MATSPSPPAIWTRPWPTWPSRASSPSARRTPSARVATGCASCAIPTATGSRSSRRADPAEMVDNATMAKLLERFAQGVAAHDRENPDHNSWGIGMAHFDIDRLGLEEGEEILPGIVLQADGGGTGNFRVLCDGEHDGAGEIEEEEVVAGVAPEEIGEPVYVDGPAEPIRP